MLEFIGMPQERLAECFIEAGFPKFRARQVTEYLYKRRIFDIDAMMQLPKALRDWMKANGCISLPDIVKEDIASDGLTRKLLLRLQDGNTVETVLMKQSYGYSVCVSSQVGCAMGCIFCASTTGGLYRNLETHEIVSQVLLFAAVTGERIHSLVVMGAGEPMQNYDNTVAALRFIHEPYSFDMGFRRMTLSTCGLPDGIRRLAEENIPITLALSLHAPTDALRRTIMPIGKYHPLEDVLSAVGYYYEKTARRLTFEYILIRGLNDGEAEAKELGRLAEACGHAHVNLIPVNGNEHIDLVRPSKKAMSKFVSIVESFGVTAVVRKEMGDEIKAACGQLKADYEERRT